MAIARGESIPVRNTQTGDEATLLGHTCPVLFVAFSPDGKRMVSASYDQTIRIWYSETGNVVAGPLKGHTDSVFSAVFSTDGRRCPPLVTTPFASGIRTLAKWCQVLSETTPGL